MPVKDKTQMSRETKNAARTKNGEKTQKHLLFAQFDSLVNVQSGSVQTSDTLLKALEPTVAAEMIEKCLKNDRIYHTKALVQDERLQKLEKERPLIHRDKLGENVAKKQICATDGDAILEANARKLFEVY